MISISHGNKGLNSFHNYPRLTELAQQDGDGNSPEKMNPEHARGYLLGRRSYLSAPV